MAKVRIIFDFPSYIKLLIAVFCACKKTFLLNTLCVLTKIIFWPCCLKVNCKQYLKTKQMRPLFCIREKLIIVIWVMLVLWFYEDLDMQKLSAKWVLKCLNVDQKMSTVPVVWATFGIFVALYKWFPVATGDHGWNLVISLWPRDKATISEVAA